MLADVAAFLSAHLIMLSYSYTFELQNYLCSWLLTKYWDVKYARTELFCDIKPRVQTHSCNNTWILLQSD